MPLKWQKTTDPAPAPAGACLFEQGAAPLARLTLSAHRSLSATGFVWFIGLTAALLLIPLSSVLGTAALWVLLPHLLGTLALTWYALRRSNRDILHEVLSLWDDRIELTRHNPRKANQHWAANPHWVQVKLHKGGGPVENYITLRGNKRTVEIGAFLSPQERLSLYNDLARRLG